MSIAKYACGICDKLKNCNWISNDPGYIQSVIAKLLCSVAEGLDTIVTTGVIINPLGAEIVNLYQETAFGAVSNTFAAVITDAHKKLAIVVDNETNQPIEVSYDGTNVHDWLSPSSASINKLGEMGRYETGNIYIRYTSTYGAPSAGSVLVSAKY